MVLAWKVQGNVQETSNMSEFLEFSSGHFSRCPTFPTRTLKKKTWPTCLPLQCCINISLRRAMGCTVLHSSSVSSSSTFRWKFWEMTGGCWCQWIGLREHLNRKPWFLQSNIGGSGWNFPVIQFCADDATGCVAVGDADATGFVRFDFSINCSRIHCDHFANGLIVDSTREVIFACVWK